MRTVVLVADLIVSSVISYSNKDIIRAHRNIYTVCKYMTNKTD